MASRYIKIKHLETGEEVVIDTYLSRYRRLAMGFMNSLRLYPHFVKHITLTQSVKSYHPRILDGFMGKMRRFYGDLLYLWTTEIQEERLERTGQRVIHWHIMVGFDRDIEFGKEDVLRIQKYWKYGNEKNSVEITPVHKPSVAYLMKYITKSLDVGLEVEGRVRRMGSSRIAGWLRQSWKKVCIAISKFQEWGVAFDTLFDFLWDRKGPYVYVEENPGRQKLRLFEWPSSGWSRVGEFDGPLPF